MFYKHKLLFLIIHLIFCIFLFYFINQQFILAGIFSNFIIDLLIIFISVVIVSYLSSKAVTMLYIIVAKLAKLKIYKRFIFWLLFTFFCYILDFIIFAVAIEY